MDEERQRKDDDALQNEVDRVGKDKKKNKSKFSMIASRLAKIMAVVMPLLKIMIPIVIGAFIISALTHILNLEGDNNTAGVASQIVIKENTTIEEAIDEDGNGQGYYFKINKEIIQRYLEELNHAYYLRILG